MGYVPKFIHLDHFISVEYPFGVHWKHSYNQNNMMVYNVLLLIALCVWVIIRNKYIVLLWYNKWYWSGECKRTYIKLFEV